MKIGSREFREVWAVDFEFCAPSGEQPDPLCMVALELGTGQILRFRRDELGDMPSAPFPTDDGVLFVAYYASAELGCFLSLGWPSPVNVLDLYCEFRNATNGVPTPCGASLLGALACYGIDGLDSVEKESMRELALRGGSYTPTERRALMDYCQSDVDALAKLLPKMQPQIDLPRALLRGRYMAAAAKIEQTRRSFVGFT